MTNGLSSSITAGMIQRAVEILVTNHEFLGEERVLDRRERYSPRHWALVDLCFGERFGN